MHRCSRASWQDAVRSDVVGMLRGVIAQCCQQYWMVRYLRWLDVVMQARCGQMIPGSAAKPG